MIHFLLFILYNKSSSSKKFSIVYVLLCFKSVKNFALEIFLIPFWPYPSLIFAFIELDIDTILQTSYFSHNQSNTIAGRTEIFCNLLILNIDEKTHLSHLLFCMCFDLK